jgi:hypothetical protein
MLAAGINRSEPSIRIEIEIADNGVIGNLKRTVFAP